MATNSVLDSFVRTYSDRTYKYPTFVRHKGTVIAFAMDDQRKIYYSVLNPDAETEGWSETPVELIFPTEIAQVGFGAAGQTVLPVFKQTNPEPEPPGAVLPPFNSRDEMAYDYFRSTTGRLTSDAPFQVLSDGQYVYVFRQALADSEADWFQGMVFIDSTGNLITSKDGTSSTVGYTDSTDTWNDLTYDASTQTWRRAKTTYILSFETAPSTGPKLNDTLTVGSTQWTVLTVENATHFEIQFSGTGTVPSSLPTGDVTLNNKNIGSGTISPAYTGITVAPLAQATLLVDRFMLVGTQSPAASPDGAIEATARLQGKLEVRYQRSRMKTSPKDRKDSLGARDLNGNLFHEPTQELDFVGSLDQGRFTVLLLPTQVANLSRWQIFAYNANTRLINSFNIERSADGLFNTRGSESYDYDEHRVAESALLLSSNGYVTLGPGAALGANSFSQEAWVYPTSITNLQTTLFGFMKHLTASRKYRSNGPSIWMQGQQLCLGFSNGTYWYEQLSPSIGSIKQGEWVHIATTFDGTAYCLYVNGDLVHLQSTWDRYDQTKDPVTKIDSVVLTGIKPAGTHPIFLGMSSNCFNGMIEEVRFWNRARSQEELQGDMHRRLTGLEPGLVGYWRFDEGSGTNVYDLTDSQKNGKIQGTPQWQTSTAPVGETAGINRNIFRFDGRDVTSGLTALLYFRQADSASGYGGEQKPLKQEGRVLLAAATKLNNPNLGNGTITSEVTKYILYLVSSLSRKLIGGTDTLQVGSSPVTVKADAEAGGKEIEISFSGNPPSTLPSGAVTLTTNNSQSLGNGTIRPVYTLTLPSLSTNLNFGDKLTVKSTTVTVQTAAVAGATQTQIKIMFPGTPPSLPLLGAVTLVTNNPYIAVLDFGLSSTGKLAQVPDVISLAAITKPDQKLPSEIIQQISDLNAKPTLVSLQEQINQLTLDIGPLQAIIKNPKLTQTLKQQYLDQLQEKITQRDKLQQKYDDLKAQYDALLNQLTDGPYQVPMQVINVDPAGLTVTGGLLNFAWTVETPRLFDSATGNVALYYRGSGDQFFVAYYQSMNGISQVSLLDNSQNPAVLAAVRSSDLSINPSTFTVTIADKTGDNTKCTVTITSGNITENWNKVPRDPIQFVQVLSGWAGERLRVGTGTVSLDPASNYYTLNLPAPLEDVSTTSFYIGDTKMKAATPPAAKQNTKNTMYITPPSAYPWPSALLDVYLPFDDGTVSQESGSGTSYYLTLNTRKLKAPPRPGTVLYVGSTKATVNKTPASTAEKIYISPPEGTIANPWSGKQTVFSRHGLGSVSQEAVSNTSYYALNLNAPLFSEEVPETGVSFYFGDTKVTVGPSPATNQNPAQKIYITPPSPYPWPSAELGVYLPALYDYDTDGNHLHNGSRLMVAIPFSGLYPDLPPPASAPQIKNQALPLSAQPCQWTADMPGTTLDLNGSNGYAGLDPSISVRNTNITGDLTLEAWARPKQTGVAGLNPTDFHYIVKQGSGALNYTLGLKSGNLLSALQFDPLAFPVVENLNMNIVGSIAIKNSALLQFVGAITVEVWIQPRALSSQATDTIFIVSKGKLGSAFRVGLRLLGNSKYQFGRYEIAASSGAGFYASMDIPPEDKTGTAWVHLAGAYDPADQKWKLYRNGIIAKDSTNCSDAKYLTDDNVNAPWSIGYPQDWAGGDPIPGYGVFKGPVDEVRIWQRARTNEQILADMSRRLSGQETDLKGYWHFDGGGTQDHTRYHNDGTLKRMYTETNPAPIPVASPLQGNFLVAGIDDNYWSAAGHPFASGSWEHLAAALHMPAALHLDGPHNYLDAGKGETLNLNTELTIEVFLQVDDVKHSYGILSRGDFAGGAGPYALAMLEGGCLVFSFQDVNGKVHTFTSARALQPNKPHKVAVKRSKINTAPAQISNIHYMFGWSDITFYIDGSNESKKYVYIDDSASYNQIVRAINAAQNSDMTTLEDALTRIPAPADGSKNYVAPNIGRSNAAVEIGRAYAAGLVSGTPSGAIESLAFRGILFQVRLWNKALDADKIFQPLEDSPSELVAWWRFSEGDGKEVSDHAGQNHARIKGAPNWTKDPDPSNWTMSLYRNGETLFSTPMAASDAPAKGDDQFTLGACKDTTKHQMRDLFKGELEEVRIWNVARTPQQIRDNLFGRLQGDFGNLVAYYTFDASLRDLNNSLDDLSPLGNSLKISSSTQRVPSTAPIGQDTPQVRSALAGIHTPFSGLIQSQPDAQEYGQLQYDSRGNLIGVFKRCYTFIQNGQWQLITGFKVGDLYTEWVGQAQFAPQLYGFIEGAPPVPGENLTERAIEFLGTFGEYNDASTVTLIQADRTTNIISASRDTGFDMSIEGLVGGGVSSETSLGIGIIEEAVDSEALAQLHFLFEYSKSWLEDASIAIGKEKRLSIAMKLRGRWQNPDEDFSLLQDRRFLPDNTGMALVQSETADIFALRLRSNNALISYQIRPNPDISKDWNIVTFPIDPHYTKQGTLDGKLGTAVDPDYPNAKDYSPDISYFKPIEAYRLKDQIEDEEAKLQTYFEQYAAGAIGRGESEEQSGAMLTQGGSGQILMANLASGLYDRTTNLQYLKDRIEGLAKRNLVNTYVWTADGGFFAETEQTMDAIEEQAGGSYSFKGMAGAKFHLRLNLAKFLIETELDALFGGHIDTTVTKSQSSETAFELEVEIDKVENDLYEHTYDEEGNWFYTLKNGRPQKKPGKVDAYRFMTFFLAPKNDYHDLFFDKVVDQSWLRSDDPGAMALRQARDDTRRPAAWRIMHRVTYVSRVLADIDDRPSPDPLERKLQTLDIDSNYELIKKLEPYVANRLGSYAEFSRAVDEALERYLPELVSYAGEIKRFLSLYFGVDYDVPKT